MKLFRKGYNPATRWVVRKTVEVLSVVDDAWAKWAIETAKKDREKRIACLCVDYKGSVSTEFIPVVSTATMRGEWYVPLVNGPASGRVHAELVKEYEDLYDGAAWRREYYEDEFVRRSSYSWGERALRRESLEALCVTENKEFLPAFIWEVARRLALGNWSLDKQPGWWKQKSFTAESQALIWVYDLMQGRLREHLVYADPPREVLEPIYKTLCRPASSFENIGTLKQEDGSVRSILHPGETDVGKDSNVTPTRRG